jgi:hypothetical protein
MNNSYRHGNKKYFKGCDTFDALREAISNLLAGKIDIATGYTSEEMNKRLEGLPKGYNFYRDPKRVVSSPSPWSTAHEEARRCAFKLYAEAPTTAGLTEPRDFESDPFAGLRIIQAWCRKAAHAVSVPPQNKGLSGDSQQGKKRPPVKDTIQSLLYADKDLEHRPTELRLKVNKKLKAQGYAETDLPTVKTTLTRIRREREKTEN